MQGYLHRGRHIHHSCDSKPQPFFVRCKQYCQIVNSLEKKFLLPNIVTRTFDMMCSTVKRRLLSVEIGKTFSLSAPLCLPLIYVHPFDKRQKQIEAVLSVQVHDSANLHFELNRIHCPHPLHHLNTECPTPGSKTKSPQTEQQKMATTPTKPQPSNLSSTTKKLPKKLPTPSPNPSYPPKIPARTFTDSGISFKMLS